MNATALFSESILIRNKCSTEQRSIFKYWSEHNTNPVYEPLAWDLETTGLSFGLPTVRFVSETEAPTQHKDIVPFGISMCIPYKDRFAIIWARYTTELFEECIKLLRVKGQKVGHNIRYDLRVCNVNKIPVKGINNCTLTMARIHWNRRTEFDLKTLTKLVAIEYSGYEDELKSTLRNLRSSYTRAGNSKGYVNYSFIPDEIISEYAMKDAFITWLLNCQLRPEIDSKHKKIYARERSTMMLVKKMELNGMPFDVKAANLECAGIVKLLPKIKRELFKSAGAVFNPNSPKQLLSIVLNKLRIPKEHLYDTKSKKYTTNKNQLKKAVPKNVTNIRFDTFVYTLLELRAYNKIKNTYLIPLAHKAKLNNGLVFFNINPNDTKTGRMASNDPSLHTMPRPVNKDNIEKHNPVRSCFINAPNQTNVFIDYCQMEMWLFAITAEEHTMLKVLLSGADIHASVAYQIFGDSCINLEKGEDQVVWSNGKLSTMRIDKQYRFKCKAVNFGIIYGMGFKALAQQIKSSEVDAFDLLKAYKQQYPVIDAKNEENKLMLKKKGYIEDIFGKKYNISVNEAYKGINAQVQGGCAQLVKEAMLNINAQFKYVLKDTAPIWRLQIHDELIFSLLNKYKHLWGDQLGMIENLMSENKILINKGIILKVDGNISETNWQAKHKYPETLKKSVEAYRRQYGISI